MKIGRKLAAIFLAVSCLVPQYGAEAEQKYIALTFDDGPGAVTETLLDGLARRDVRATFFLCCYRMAQYPDAVRKMAADGHEVGLHGCSHLYFTQMNEQALQQELTCTADRISSLTGKTPTLLRPPGGLYNEQVRKTAEQMGFSLILWSVDPEDWNPRKRKNTANHVVQTAKHGDIILLHDLSEDNAEAALKAIDELRARGFRFCTVTGLAQMAGQTLAAGKIYRRFF